jgi:hypothetical protein
LTMVESSVCMKKLADTSHSSGCSERCGAGLAGSAGWVLKAAAKVSAAGTLCVITQSDQFLDQAIAVIALNLNVAVLDRTPGAAQFLKARGQGFQVRADSGSPVTTETPLPLRPEVSRPTRTRAGPVGARVFSRVAGSRFTITPRNV